MYDALVQALVEAEANPEVRVLLLTGAPGCFTAGNDLSDFVANPPSGPESPVFRFLLAMSRFPKPVVAAVDGPAVGLGTTVLLHCDLVVATPRVKFLMPFTALGLVPEFASSLLLPARVGWQRAAEWLMLGEGFGAEAAREAGLVNRVVEPEALESAALALAQGIAARPAEAVLQTKALMKAGIAPALDAAMLREADVFIARLHSDEARAVMTAFLNRGR